MCACFHVQRSDVTMYVDCFEGADFKEIVKQLYRITKKGGVVVWVVGDATMKGSETGTSFRQALGFIEGGFKLHDTMIYEKNTSSFPAQRKGKRYTQIFEYMFVFCKGKIFRRFAANQPNNRISMVFQRICAAGAKILDSISSYLPKFS